uniref:apyrase n=2 Tax=Culicoides sonorensis TaxID=179676 RepID=A0A336LY46_CULSO
MARNFFVIIFSLKFLSWVIADQPLSITLIHINDLHARYEPVTATSKSEDCSEEPKVPCIAGYARVVHAIRSLKKKYKNHNPIYINAGDNFQGTVWYGFLRWDVSQAMMNLEPPSLQTLGNHEFDHGVPNLALYLNKIKWPVICANINTRNEPSIHQKINEGVVQNFLVNGELVRVGFIGVIYDKTNLTTNTGSVIFENSIVAVKCQAERLKRDGINKIVVVSHCGYAMDLQIAEEVGDLIDVIVGSHSHTLLWPNYKLNEYPYKNDIVDEYPKVIHPKIAPHRKVLVLQAYCHGKVVGAIKIDFDRNGEVQNWEANPLYLNEKYPQDNEINKQLDVWRAKVDEKSKVNIGKTKVLLEGKNCRWGECTLGNVIARIFRKSYAKKFPDQQILAMVQAASFKGDLQPGDITEGDLMRVFPFDSSVDIMELKGKYIRRSLEKAAILDRKKRFNFFQRSGFKVTYDMSKKENERVIDVHVFVKTGKYEALKDEKTYKFVTISFIANGGDNFTEISLNKQNHHVGPDSKDVIKAFLKENVITEVDVKTKKTIVNSCPYCEEKKQQ